MILFDFVHDTLLVYFFGMVYCRFISFLLLFLLLFSPASRNFYLSSCSLVSVAAIRYSQQVPWYVFWSTCSFCLCHMHCTSSRNSLVFIRLPGTILFRSSYFSGGVFFLSCSRTRYASTWFAYLDSFSDVWVSSVSLCVTTQFCISLRWRTRKDTGGTAVIGYKGLFNVKTTTTLSLRPRHYKIVWHPCTLSYSVSTAGIGKVSWINFSLTGVTVDFRRLRTINSVSYTHLTLPTKA